MEINTRMVLNDLNKADRLYRLWVTPFDIVEYLDDYPIRQLRQFVDRYRQVASATTKSMWFRHNPRVIERCILMTTDPGDLVLDPTCGSGTTAYVAEQWGRRWITIDTSRVALALARARIMGARYSYYLLADSRDGQLKEAEITRTAPSKHRPAAISARASSTSACRISRSNPLPTTPRST